MQKLKNSVAIVTGAGSGIGQQLAIQLAKHGAKIGISDINSQALETTKQQVENLGAVVHSVVLDVSDREAMFAYADAVTEALGAPNLVINNAGVALSSGTLQNTKIEEFEWLMGINFSGVLYGTKAFLPKLRQADWGHIVNISSIFGMIGVPEQTAYNASKFAVRGLTEALRQELELEDSHISCTSVHPGGIKTNIAVNARIGKNFEEAESLLLIEQNAEMFEQLARTTAESAAQQILNAVVKNKRRLLIGSDAKFLDWVQRHFPNYYHHVFQYLANRMARKVAADNA